MLRNYLLVTFRNLLKNKVFTIINILGLGIALAVCIVAFFNHVFNYEFNRTHKNFDKIYRITSFRDMQGREQEYGNVPATLGRVIKNDIPGIEMVTRFTRSYSPVKEGDNVFSSQISCVDPDFLKIFTIPLLSGEWSGIENKGNAFVSKKMAERLFGKEYAVSKTLTIVNDKNKEYTYTICGVFADLPENSSFKFDVLTHFDNFLTMYGGEDSNWKMPVNAIFMMVPDKSFLSSIARELKNYLPVQNKAREDFKINRFNIVPLKDVGSNSRKIWGSSLNPSMHPAAIKAPPVMALFILLIACFNFANTSISTFGKRLKEIGLRKTFGGQRRQLVVQFLIETIIICFLALLAGIAFAKYLVPAYSSLWSYMSIELTFTKYGFFWVFLILLLFLTGFISGVYPAIYVSSFSPVNVLKGASPFRGSGKLSSVLLGLQLTISVFSVVLGTVFVKNGRYQQTLDLGYDKERLIVVSLPQEYYTSFRNEILSNPKILSAAGTQEHIGFGGYRRPIKDQEKRLEVDVMNIGPEYPAVIGMHLLAGRWFEESRASADRRNNSILVNEKLVKAYEWKDPVGKSVTLYDTTKLTVIGVVSDFYLNGLWEEIEPTMMRLAPADQYGNLIVKAEKKDLKAVLGYLNQKWKSMSTNYVFDGMLQEDTLQDERDINKSIMKVNIFLAVTATLLSLIGMYNLVSLDVIHRTKEMGIRKIQGASVPIIMFLSSKKFLIILSVASILGCAGGYYLSLKLLDSIWDYFVKITIGMLLFSVLIIFTATAATLIFKISRAASRNPVDTLRYE